MKHHVPIRHRKFPWMKGSVKTKLMGWVDVSGVSIRVETSGDPGFTDAVFGVTVEDRKSAMPVVVLAQGLSRKAQDRVLLHEMIHAVAMLYGLKVDERATRVLEMTFGEMLGTCRVRVRKVRGT